MFIKLINSLKKKKAGDPAKSPVSSREATLLEEIHDILLKKYM